MILRRLRWRKSFRLKPLNKFFIWAVKTVWCWLPALSSLCLETSSTERNDVFQTKQETKKSRNEISTAVVERSILSIILFRGQKYWKIHWCVWLFETAPTSSCCPSQDRPTPSCGSDPARSSGLRPSKISPPISDVHELNGRSLFLIFWGVLDWLTRKFCRVSTS